MISLTTSLSTLSSLGVDSLGDIDPAHFLAVLRNEYLTVAKDLSAEGNHPEDQFLGEKMCEVAEKLQEAIDLFCAGTEGEIEF